MKPTTLSMKATTMMAMSSSKLVNKGPGKAVNKGPLKPVNIHKSALLRKPSLIASNGERPVTNGVNNASAGSDVCDAMAGLRLG